MVKTCFKWREHRFNLWLGKFLHAKRPMYIYIYTQALKWLLILRYPAVYREDRQARLFLALLFGASSHMNIPQISC